MMVNMEAGLCEIPYRDKHFKWGNFLCQLKQLLNVAQSNGTTN